MSLLAPPSTAVRPAGAAQWRAAGQLARGEAWRIVTHPVALAGLALNVALIVVVGSDGGRSSFSAVTAGSTFYSGVFTYFAANLVATRERRSRAGELLAPLPAGPHARTLALCLAALGPALLNAALVAAAYAAFAAREMFLVAPSFWHAAQGPLTVLGGALLGVMVGRWAPYPGAALVVMVAMVAFNMVVADSPDYRPLGTEVGWARSGPDHDRGGWYGYHPGSVAWHDAYLLGLCVMAAVGALLRTASERLPLLVLAGAATAATAVAGWAQLPSRSCSARPGGRCPGGPCWAAARPRRR
jgi:hypothetical protein